jgi:AcrR family transcriptional regulator
VFDPRNPYERHMWHYESDRPLSVAQLIALGSLDAQTAALLWLLIEHHVSFIISGPTDPTPGIGKTTTLNAMLDFLPNGTSLVYTSGMFERFDFLEVTEAASTCVLCNEVSDHLRIYMWGRVARRFLSLTTQGYAIATSMHADTLDDVLSALLDDLHLAPDVVSQLGIIINIGIVGRVWPPRRRFLTVNLLRPALAPTTPNTPPTSEAGVPPSPPERVRALSLACWEAKRDAFTPPDEAVRNEVAQLLGMETQAFDAALQRRIACLQELAIGNGATLRATRRAIATLQDEEQHGQ